MIVGFPGETEEDFERLLAFCERVRFDRLGAFAFSPEEDTPAYRMNNQVDEDIKQERLDKLMAQQQRISLELNQQRVGKRYQVLITQVTGKTAQGRSAWEAPDSDGIIAFTHDGSLKEGDFVTVLIDQATAYDLSGQAVQGETEQ
jgi:ribosomal protein S12 methylthiotransferase